MRRWVPSRVLEGKEAVHTGQVKHLGREGDMERKGGWVLMGEVLRCDVESVEWWCGEQCVTRGMKVVEGWLRC
jgi:hypothetical protein